MNEVFIGGVNLNDLKRQKELMKKDAVAFISNSIATVKELVGKMKTTPSSDEVEMFAEEAHEILINIRLVSGITGVKFLLPYYEEYGNYDSDEVMSQQLEEFGATALVDCWGRGSPLQNLADLLEGMEGSSRDWYSSKC